MSDGSPLLCGVLDTLSSLFKHGKREDVLDLATPVLSRLGGCDLTESDNTQLRKLHVKLMQWVGMVFLPPRLASWRYQRGGRSLEEALATSPGVLQSSQEVSVFTPKHSKYPLVALRYYDSVSSSVFVHLEGESKGGRGRRGGRIRGSF